ncbi:TetR/AcrR family transcriptional regulator [Streptomyces marincola]|uniref:TetR/AcrR family transcriptional regulator n=1 Tax=Streptomyces marincola TaxID=2878388 RepID=UPI001CF2D701|nr:TetR/AcrR family transcriptional regulator [Streptomyces marincola]UCM90932.1 TetR/AcrR family transcriptional regulator [Streptomyces marincola]
MPGRRAESRRRNAEALTRAAEQLFTRHGYQAVGIERIAEEAGLTTGAIYSIFGAKQGLLLAVLDSALHRVAAAARALEDDQDLTAAEVVAAFARAYCGIVGSLAGRRALRLEAEALALALQDDARGGELLQRLGRTRHHLAELLTGRRVHPADRRRLTSDEAATLAGAEAAILHGLAHQAAVGAQEPDPELWARAATAMVALVDEPGPAGSRGAGSASSA